jgi:hypothetical protein
VAVKARTTTGVIGESINHRTEGMGTLGYSLAFGIVEMKQCMSHYVGICMEIPKPPLKFEGVGKLCTHTLLHDMYSWD